MSDRAESTSQTEAFLEAAGSAPRMFWLDGGGARPWAGARSVLGVLADDDISLTFDAATRQVTRHTNGAGEVIGSDIFTVLAQCLAYDEGDSDVSWVGYFGYACRTDLPGRPAGSSAPDAVWMRLRAPLQIAGGKPSARRPLAGALAATVTQQAPDRAYAAGFAEVQRQLRAGNSYEVNLTYRRLIAAGISPPQAYLALRELNPAPYSGYLQHHGVALLSSSPERFATVDRHRVIEAKPIKGTTARSDDDAEDAAAAQQLRSDPKFRAENLMITDLLRNDLAMVCKPGTVEVPALMEVESYETVHQLVSTVRGDLRDDLSTVEALRQIFPAGSMTGAPKRRTMEIIDAVEQTPRGVYAGAFGWLSADGRADLAVVIRSLVARAQGPGYEYTLGTGGGITVASQLSEEYAETLWKAARLSAALGSL